MEQSAFQDEKNPSNESVCSAVKLRQNACLLLGGLPLGGLCKDSGLTVLYFYTVV